MEIKGPKCREIFQRCDFESDKFIEMLQSSTRNPDVEVDGDYFRLKKAYPVSDKESLRKFIIKHGTYGIRDDE